MKSVKSIYPCKSVIQTINDIIKAHGGEIKVSTKEGEGLSVEALAETGSELLFSYRMNEKIDICIVSNE